MPFGSFGNHAAQQQGSIGKGLKYSNRSRLGINLNRYLLDDISGLRTIFSDTVLTNYAKNNFWIRVRRTSDNAEQDFVYKNGLGDYASLLTFCSGTDGYIAKRYNQVQTKDDLTITDTAKQQQIVSS